MIMVAYDSFNDLRLDPIGLTAYSNKFSFEDREYEFVLLGDSHAANWKMEGKDVLNLGITSQTSHQTALRSDILKQTLKGQTLIIVVGANDILSTLTNKKQKDEIIKNCLENIHHIISNHETHFKRIVVMTVPPFFRFPKKYLFVYDSACLESIAELNKGINSVCRNDKNVFVLDAHRLLSEKATGEKLTTDGLHLNISGYQYLNKILD